MPILRIPRSLAYGGVAYLRCEHRTVRQFRFDRLAAELAATPWATADISGELWDMEGPKKHDRYRVALRQLWPNGTRAKVGFCLGKRTPQATLEVIARHLDREGIDWLWLTDANGTRLKGHRFISHLNSPGA
jgi:hypothetical protein